MGGNFAKNDSFVNSTQSAIHDWLSQTYNKSDNVTNINSTTSQNFKFVNINHSEVRCLNKVYIETKVDKILAISNTVKYDDKSTLAIHLASQFKQVANAQINNHQKFTLGTVNITDNTVIDNLSTKIESFVKSQEASLISQAINSKESVNQSNEVINKDYSIIEGADCEFGTTSILNLSARQMVFTLFEKKSREDLLDNAMSGALTYTKNNQSGDPLGGLWGALGTVGLVIVIIGGIIFILGIGGVIFLFVRRGKNKNPKVTLRQSPPISAPPPSLPTGGK